MATIDETGYTPDTLEQRLEKYYQRIKTFQGDNARFDEKSINRKLATLIAESDLETQHLIAAVMAAHNPKEAGGVFLEKLVAFNGIEVNDSRFSTVTLKVTSRPTAGATIPAGALVEDPTTGEKVATDT